MPTASTARLARVVYRLPGRTSAADGAWAAETQIDARTLLRILRDGLHGTSAVWRLCRSAAGYWTLYEHAGYFNRTGRALLVASSPCDELLGAGRLLAFDVYPSGATLYELSMLAS